MPPQRAVVSHIKTKNTNAGVVVRLGLSIVTQLLVLGYIGISYYRHWSFSWQGFSALFGLIAACNTAVAIYTWRKRREVGMRLQIFILDWSTAWLWYGIFGPLYQILVVQLSDQQLKVDAMVYLISLMTFGSVIYTATQFELKRVVDYARTGQTDNPLRLYKLASKFPKYVILRNTTVSIIGYYIGSTAMHLTAGLPRIEFYKNIGVGVALAIFLSLFYYLVYTSYLGRIKSKLISQYNLSDQISSRYSWNVVATTGLIALGSMSLAFLIFVNSMQGIVQKNVSTLLKERFVSAANQAKDFDDDERDLLRIGERGLVVEISQGQPLNGVLVSDETSRQYTAMSSGIILDGYIEQKIIGVGQVNGQRVTSVVYLSEYYDIFWSSYQYLAIGLFFILAAALSVMALFSRTIGSTINRLIISVRKSQKSGKFSNPGINSGDELELLSRAFEQFVTQTRQKTTQLDQEHARLEASIAGLQLGFIMTDVDDTILEWNTAASRILFGKLKARPNSLQEAVAALDDDEELARKLLYPVETLTRPKQVSLRYRSKYLDILMGPILANDKFLGKVILIQDVTEQQVLSRSKEEFFSIASHELRTPLTVIRGNTSMMLDLYEKEFKRNDGMKQMVLDMHHASVGLIEIVNDFLDASRLEQGKMTFMSQTIRCDELVGHVMRDFSVLAQEKGIKLEIKKSLDDQLPPAVADPEKVKQIFYNLIGNALKFTEKGSITVSLSHDAHYVHITVTDTGRGISQENQKLLFRKFQQAGSSILTRDTTRGTGLGLYISRLMIQNMGGVIELVNSETNRGSTFRLSLPIDKS